jgi:hypothetical protein
MALQIVTEGTTLKFSGDTYNFRDLIKALPGARWVAAEMVWTAPVGADLTAIKARMAEYEHSRAFWANAIAATAHLSRPREEWTRAQWRAFCARPRARGESGNHGPCCSGAKPFTQYDAQGPTCYRCEKHGETINCYSGD